MSDWDKEERSDCEVSALRCLDLSLAMSVDVRRGDREALYMHLERIRQALQVLQISARMPDGREFGCSTCSQLDRDTDDE